MNNQSIGIVGGMGGVLNEPSMGQAPPEQQAGLEIGVMEDKIGFKIFSAEGNPIILLFTIAEMYGIISAQEQAIAYIRKNVSKI